MNRTRELELDPWVATASGNVLSLLNPKAGDVDIDSVARALSHLCRYTGDVVSFYSVAQHSVHVAQTLRYRGPRVALAGLLHDCAEAYMGDISYPVQVALFGDDPQVKARYKRIQRGLENAILDHVNRAIPASAELNPEDLHHPIVAEVDLRILIDERAALKIPCPRPWGVDEAGLTGLGIDIEPWDSALARDLWIRAYNALVNDLVDEADEAGGVGADGEDR